MCHLSHAKTKVNTDRAVSKQERSERVTSELFEENKEMKQQLDEATSEAKSLQSELLKANKTNILLKLKLDAYDVAFKRFQKSLTKKYPAERKLINLSNKLWELEFIFREAEQAILFKASMAKDMKRSRNAFIPFSPMPKNVIDNSIRSFQPSIMKEEMLKFASQQAITRLPTILMKTPIGKRNAPVSPGQ